MLSLSLPDEVKAVWRINNGQNETMLASSLVPGVVCLPTLSFLSTHLVIAVWREWAELRRTSTDLAELQAAGRSASPGVVQPLYTHAAWVPLWADPTRADSIGIDLAPAEKGTSGQVINFGRNEERHFVFAERFERLLEVLLEEVESGAWPASKLSYGGGTIDWLGDPTKSLFEALHRRSQATAPMTPAQQFNATLKAAKAAFALQQLDEALALADQALHALPENSGAQALKIELLVAVKRVVEARALYDALIARAPRFPRGAALKDLLDAAPV